ncbi:MAG: DUF2723 domain-containing protein [Ignavibacteriaceae bacterium]|nr:DUF2723 domain-containing protein [Ignavibacteriaceae bacterium]
MNNFNRFIKRNFHFLAAFSAFVLYFLTHAKTVMQIDSGELAAVQTLLGIAHPTGYPLFTVLGFIVTQIPFPISEIHKLNLLASTWVALSIGVFSFTVKYTLDNLVYLKPSEPAVKISKKKKEKAQKTAIIPLSEIDDVTKYLAAFGSSLILAFSKTYWMMSTSVEVYSLHILLICIVWLVIFRAFIRNTAEIHENEWFLLAIALALGFSNHLTTLLILPGLAYFYFSMYGFNKRSFLRIGKMIVLFAFVLFAVYSYLPIRALQDPVLNWGNPIDFERLYRHVSGHQYRVWLFSSFDSAQKQLTYFINNLPAEFNVNLLFIAIGIFFSFRVARKFFYFTLITFLFTVFYSINYDIHDIDSYFLLAYISLSMFAAFGIIKISQLLEDKNLGKNLSIILVMVFIIVQATLNYGKSDQSDNYLFKDYTISALNSVKQDAVIITYQWDFLISPSYYFQYVENHRNDVKIIDKELLRRSWYFNQLKKNMPDIYNRIEPEVNSFLKLLAPFERSELYDGQALETSFRRLQTLLVSTNFEHRPVYIGPEMAEAEMKTGEFALPPGYELIPDVFFFRVVNTKDYVEASLPDFTIRVPSGRDDYHSSFIQNALGSMLVRRAMYEMQFDKTDRAKVYITKLKETFPDFPVPAGLAEVMR